MCEIEVAEEIEAVVEGDDDDVSAFGEADAIVDRTVAAAGGVGPAVDVDEDRTVFAVAEAGSPDVEVEAVLAVDGVCFVEGREGGAALAGMDGLRSLGTEGQSVADSLPWLRFYRELQKKKPIAVVGNTIFVYSRVDVESAVSEYLSAAAQAQRGSAGGGN